MATTPNFNWSTPDNTGLVKNGALDIRTLGNSIDASLVDLKGGTTGQVLAKATNTDMDFTWSTPSAGISNAFFAGKNKIINGDFNVNQRGFTSVTADGSYGFDRWALGTTFGTTYSTQAFTAGTAPVAGYEGTNFARLVTSGQSGTNALSILLQRIEGVRTFAGQTVTVSFWAKAGSGTPKIAVELQQNFGSGGSATVNTYAGQVTLSTSWARYSVSIAVPSMSGKTIGTSNFLALQLWTSAGTDFNSRTGSLGIQNATIDIWGVQVEAGSSATDFQTATGTIQGELAACQRYYYRTTATQAYSDFGSGYNKSTTEGSFMIPFPVTMRTTPTALEQTGTASNYNILHASGGSPARAACSSVPTYQVATPTMGRVDFIVASGLTSGNGAIAGSNNNTTAFLGWSAEL